jgi:hypothetical protein
LTCGREIGEIYSFHFDLFLIDMLILYLIYNPHLQQQDKAVWMQRSP